MVSIFLHVSWLLRLIKCAVLDLAARFADGRLSTEKLLEADDEELYEMRIAVRGIGRVSPLFRSNY